MSDSASTSTRTFGSIGPRTPTPITSRPGQRLTMNALLVDQRYLGHRVTGVDEEGRQFTGPLQKVSQQAVADRIVLTIGNTELKVSYSQVIVVTIVRSMPQDPRQRDADRVAAEFVKRR